MVPKKYDYDVTFYFKMDGNGIGGGALARNKPLWPALYTDLLLACRRQCMLSATR